MQKNNREYYTNNYQFLLSCDSICLLLALCFGFSVLIHIYQSSVSLAGTHSQEKIISNNRSIKIQISFPGGS